MDIEMIERMVTAANDAAEDYDECCTGIMMLAAIKAMREPTEKMLYSTLKAKSLKDEWQDMIDAIIGDK
jgi:hypothetical protein